MVLVSFCACKDKNEIEQEPDISTSGDIQLVVDNNTYNNGGNFVQYKGKTYYREYSNLDVEKTAPNAEYKYNTEVRSTKYINAISQNGKIENVFEDDGYGNFYIMDDRFFMTGYNNKLYSVDMNGQKYIEFCVGEYVKLDEKNHKIYYINTKNNDNLYSVDTQTLKITKITEGISEIIGVPDINNEKVDTTFISQDEIAAFRNIYILNDSEEEYIVKINNAEQVNNKIYYLIELSKNTGNTSEEGEKVYSRIVSEVYLYDTKTEKKTLLYLYKATDEEMEEDKDLHGSGDVGEILAENEMILEIKLSDKGLKDTFDVRVEEVGGLIIGKRIEYEGTHSRNEGVLKIKVTKEIGAMLTVYIDNKMDSQMLIEE